MLLMKQEEKTKYSILKKIMVVFLLIQPAFDMYVTLIGESLDIFGYSIITIIRMFTISIIAFILMIKSLKSKENLVETKFMIGYMVIILIYTVVHHFVIIKHSTYYMQNNLYSILTEVNYIFRLAMPIIMLYDFLILKFNKKDIIDILITVGVAISVVIVLSDLLGEGFISYDYNNTKISANIFEWFNKDSIYNFKQLTCKGFFYSANQITILLSLTYIITIFEILKNNNIIVSVLLGIETIAMLITGTRVGTYIPLLGIISMLIYYLSTTIMYKKKVNTKGVISIIIVLAVWFAIFLYAPQRNRQFADSLIDKSTDKIEALEKEGYVVKTEALYKILESKELMINYLELDNNKINSYSNNDLINLSKAKFLKENYAHYEINKAYIETIYPYGNDLDFWLKIIDMPFQVKADNRGLEQEIIKRIDERYGSIYTRLFGLGATPLNQRKFMVEKDIFAHYFNIGIIGIIIFISPYFIAILIAIVEFVKQLIKIKKIRFGTINTFAISLILMLCLAYNTGHALDEFIIFIYLALITSNIFNGYIKELKNRKKDKNNA